MLSKEVLFSYFPKRTQKRYKTLLKTFGSLDIAFTAEFDEFKKTKWEDNLIHEFLSWRDSIDEKQIEKTLQNENIHVITQKDEEYPELLKQIYDPPLCLFVRGNIPKNIPSISVVGSRKNSSYGARVVEEIVGELSRNGINIVSGLALGIDGLAHRAALQNQGPTVAVLGGGIDKASVYPRYHYNLSEEIIANGGAVISEYAPGTQPNRYTFPERNRIIAGMTLGTFVIEAGEKSGTLITAQCALESNREVFAVPNNIYAPSAKGTNNLIAFGAKLVQSAKDILETLDIKSLNQQSKARQVLPDSPTEAKVLTYLSTIPIHIDEITQKTELPSHVVSSTLTMMEMKGKCKNIGGMNYVSK